MRQVATVEKLLEDGRAEIVVERQSACAHDCHECAGCGSAGSPIRAVADNLIGARAGQKVIVESSSRKMLGMILLVYALPVALFFVAYAATVSLGSAVSATISVFVFFCGIVPAVLYDRSLRRGGGITFTIVRVF